MPALLSVTIFIALGFAFIFGSLTFGSFIRPKVPGAEKSASYECGEPTLGSSWVQFDLRFYIVALLFLVFDVEVALLYPWAVVYGDAARVAAGLGVTLFSIRQAAVVDLLVFVGTLLVGFAYLWRFGYLDWVKAKLPAVTSPVPKPAKAPEPQDAIGVEGTTLPDRSGWVPA